eukprot:8534128-Pyramimonas_sp.AAC.1
MIPVVVLCLHRLRLCSVTRSTKQLQRVRPISRSSEFPGLGFIFVGDGYHQVEVEGSGREVLTAHSCEDLVA